MFKKSKIILNKGLNVGKIAVEKAIEFREKLRPPQK